MTVQSDVARARDLLQRGEIAAARPLLASALEDAPTNVDARFWLGVCDQFEGYLDRAESQFGQVVAQDTHFAKAWYGLGTVLEQKGDDEAAHALYFRAAAEGSTAACARVKELGLEPPTPAPHTDAERIREQTQAALVAEGAQSDRQNEAAATYAEAVQAVNAEHYQEALDKLVVVEQLDPTFTDPRMVAATAREKLSRPAQLSRARLRRNVAIGGVCLAILAGLFVLVPRSRGIQEVMEEFDHVGYDDDVWAWPAGADVTQQGDVLAIRVSGSNGQAGIKVAGYSFDPSHSMFFEAGVRLDPEALGGNLLLGLCCEPMDTNCLIGPEQVACWFNSGSRIEWEHRESSYHAARWHDFRIEFDADEQRFTYFINGEQVGSVTPSSKALAETYSEFLVRVHNELGPRTVGYVDYLHIGPLED